VDTGLLGTACPPKLDHISAGSTLATVRQLAGLQRSHTHTLSTLTQYMCTSHTSHTPQRLLFGAEVAFPSIWFWKNCSKMLRTSGVVVAWERTRLDSSATHPSTPSQTPLPLPPLHPEVTHTIVCFGFFGLASRATLLAARLQQRTPRTVNMSVSHHDMQGDTPRIYTCRPLPKSDPSQLDESPHGRSHQHQVLI